MVVLWCAAFALPVFPDQSQTQPLSLSYSLFLHTVPVAHFSQLPKIRDGPSDKPIPPSSGISPSPTFTGRIVVALIIFVSHPLLPPSTHLVLPRSFLIFDQQPPLLDVDYTQLPTADANSRDTDWFTAFSACCSSQFYSPPAALAIGSPVALPVW